jgi:tRNA-specific 2-thiouridylase
MTGKRVFLGMSGGVDSTVAAILLKKAGYEVVGYTYRVYDSMDEDCIRRQRGCCTVEAIYEAKAMCEMLGIAHHIIDMRIEFADTVIQKFTAGYMEGTTPNPCVDCNYYIKWGRIREWADKHQCVFLATGHYTSIRQDGDKYYLSSAADTEKDQSYFLWRIPRELLGTTLFPLGSMKKDEVRSIAADHGLKKLAVKPDSQEICFIPGDEYRDFLRASVSDLPGPGNFVDVSGKILGEHMGYPFYTVGQRKGLGIAMGERMYVVEVNKARNEVVLGLPEDIQFSGMTVSGFNPGKYDQLLPGMKLKVKTRYRSASQDSNVVSCDNDGVEIRFDSPVAAIAPGQSAVFYDRDGIAGGAVIKAGIK